MSFGFDERDRASVVRDLQSPDHEVRRLAVEDENRRFANCHLEVEEENNNLANLYVASYQLHAGDDGLKLISLMRGDDTLRDIPIVVITTEGAEQDRERALNLGANEYLTKPIQANRVLAVARALLEKD